MQLFFHDLSRCTRKYICLRFRQVLDNEYFPANTFLPHDTHAKKFVDFLFNQGFLRQDFLAGNNINLKVRSLHSFSLWNCDHSNHFFPYELQVHTRYSTALKSIEDGTSDQEECVLFNHGIHTNIFKRPIMFSDMNWNLIFRLTLSLMIEYVDIDWTRVRWRTLILSIGTGGETVVYHAFLHMRIINGHAHGYHYEPMPLRTNHQYCKVWMPWSACKIFMIRLYLLVCVHSFIVFIWQLRVSSRCSLLVFKTSWKDLDWHTWSWSIKWCSTSSSIERFCTRIRRSRSWIPRWRTRFAH